jgi:hypothetical protein
MKITPTMRAILVSEYPQAPEALLEQLDMTKELREQYRTLIGKSKSEAWFLDLLQAPDGHVYAMVINYEGDKFAWYLIQDDNPTPDVPDDTAKASIPGWAIGAGLGALVTYLLYKTVSMKKRNR